LVAGNYFHVYFQIVKKPLGQLCPAKNGFRTALSHLRTAMGQLCPAKEKVWDSSAPTVYMYE
jgi:hypothetical protein